MATNTETLMVPMSEVLSRFSAEIRELAVATGKVQDAMSPFVSGNSSWEDGHCSSLQSLDLTHQTLLGIAEIMEALAASNGCDWQVDLVAACNRTSLSGLAERIVMGGESSADERAWPGHFDCF
jgi:hypothetical protein